MADNTLEENMESILDIEVSDTPEGGCTTRKDQLKDATEDREKDYEYTRGQLYTLIDQGGEAV